MTSDVTRVNFQDFQRISGFSGNFDFNDFKASFVLSQMNPVLEVRKYDEDVCIFHP